MNNYPSEEPGQFWDDFEQQCAELAVEAHRLDLPNWQSFRYAARTAYDIAAGLSPEASKQKHLRELRQELGLPLPFEPAPRVWRTNMCGIRIAGLPAVPGGASDPTLFLSWFYDRYDAPARTIIRAAAKAHGWQQWLLSWPDSQAVGQSPAQFLATCQELIADGFYPCPMLCAKPTSSANIRTPQQTLANIMLVLPLLVGVVPAACIGWELSLWLSPTDVQFLIDAIAPQFTPAGTSVYVHLQEGYMSFPQPGQPNAAFWHSNVGKLTGVLHQRRLSSNVAWYLDLLNDCLERMAGNDGMPADSGLGHPFDLVALEITAQPQFNGEMTETQGDGWGQVAINAKPRTGPAGTVRVMGSGNGQ